MSVQDQKPPEGGNPPNPAGGPAGDGKPVIPEGFVPKEQFTASQTEAIRLKKENDELRSKVPPQNGDLPKEKIFETIDEYEKKKIEDVKKEQDAVKSSLDKLHSIHGEFDDQKVKDIVAEYGVFSEDGNINWEKALELYKKFGNPVVKKPEPGARTNDHPVEADKVEVRGKNMHDIVSEGLKKFGIGR